jgi:hypothetical protein
VTIHSESTKELPQVRANHRSTAPPALRRLVGSENAAESRVDHVDLYPASRNWQQEFEGED